MAGIYIHIPFCKQACNYCDFHFSTSLKNKDELLKAIITEIGLRKDYLENEAIESIYFGGGTPSLLDGSDLYQILNSIHHTHTVSREAEITLEANPDDLDRKKLKNLDKLGINRLSIGIQSFFDVDLKWMNRAHDAKSAHQAIVNSRDIGFNNISIDLIYGSPTTTDEMWKKNLDYFFHYQLPHLSSYCLTVESKTKLAHDIRAGSSKEPDDAAANRQFRILQKEIKNYGYEQYEVSNFCKDGLYSRHNTSYWKNIGYLGIGPSAHSFNGKSRQWNISNNIQYIKSLREENFNPELEFLNDKDRLNEYLMTMLRTKWGIDLEYLQKTFENGIYETFNKALSHPIIKENCIMGKDRLKIKAEKLIYSDAVIRQLFVE